MPCNSTGDTIYFCAIKSFICPFPHIKSMIKGCYILSHVMLTIILKPYESTSSLRSSLEILLWLARAGQGVTPRNKVITFVGPYLQDWLLTAQSSIIKCWANLPLVSIQVFWLSVSTDLKKSLSLSLCSSYNRHKVSVRFLVNSIACWLFYFSCWYFNFYEIVL